ncbi:DUF951 domain-containing protein [Natronospora cellulosivora (SeqCode)]
MKLRDYQVGDIVRFKKKHPCGGDLWKITRIGMDFKARCENCGRMIMLARRKFDKSVKEKVMESED